MMFIVENIGKRDRMVADRILHPGESKIITVKQAELYNDDADFVLVDMSRARSVLPKKHQDDVADTSPKLQEQERNATREEEKPAVKKRRGKKK